MRFFQKIARTSLVRPTRRPHHTASPRVEILESRLTPYSTSGDAWPHPELVTLSFVPDGTVLFGSTTSNLSATFVTRFGSATTGWNQILKAAQQWAAQTDLNFTVLTDNGNNAGSGSYQQGDSGFGDIRVGGYNYGTSTLASAYLPPPVNNYSIAGDVNFNTGQTWNIGSTYDLFTVAMHEIGHALGLLHGASTSVMNAGYTGVKTGLATDDINGIRAVYSGGSARASDGYDAAASNGTFATATDLTSTIDAGTLTSLVENLDVTTTSDKDFYKVTVPSGTTGTMVVKMQSSGLSLLAPKVTVYASDQTTVKGTASASSTDYDGTTLTVTVTGVSAGQVYYIKSEGLNTTAFGTGKYALTFTFGSNANPTVPLPNTQTANGSPLQSGGGIPQVTDEAGPGYHVFNPDGHDHDHDAEASPPVPANVRALTGSDGVRLATALAPSAGNALAVTAAAPAAPTVAVTPTPLTAPVATVARIAAVLAGEATGDETVTDETVAPPSVPAADPTTPSDAEAGPAAGADDGAIRPEATDAVFADSPVPAADAGPVESQTPAPAGTRGKGVEAVVAVGLALTLGGLWSGRPVTAERRRWRAASR